MEARDSLGRISANRKRQWNACEEAKDSAVIVADSVERLDAGALAW